MQKKKKRKLENDVKRVPNQASFQSNRFPIRIRNYSWNESHNPSLFRVFDRANHDRRNNRTWDRRCTLKGVVVCVHSEFVPPQTKEEEKSPSEPSLPPVPYFKLVSVSDKKQKKKRKKEKADVVDNIC